MWLCGFTFFPACVHEASWSVNSHIKHPMMRPDGWAENATVPLFSEAGLVEIHHLLSCIRGVEAVRGSAQPDAGTFSH